MKAGEHTGQKAKCLLHSSCMVYNGKIGKYKKLEDG